MRNKAKLLSLAPFPHLILPSSLQTPLPLPTLSDPQVSPRAEGLSRAQPGATTTSRAWGSPSLSPQGPSALLPTLSTGTPRIPQRKNRD